MKYCIKIENQDTYELFEDIGLAYEYLKQNPKSILSLVIANHTYKEDTGELNYEDFSDTIQEEIGGSKNGM